MAVKGSASSEILPYLSVPEYFGNVEPDVYRSNALHSHNFTFVRTLGLRTVVYLSPEVPIRQVTQFFEECGTKFINLGIQQWKPFVTWRPISEELVKEGLEIILDATSHPVMAMCSSGIHQTGTLVGCLRKLQRWNLTSIIEEYRRYAGSKARFAMEQFVELFDEDLVTLPRELPQWFTDQMRMMAEEEELAAALTLASQHHPALPSPMGPAGHRLHESEGKDEDGEDGENRLLYGSSSGLRGVSQVEKPGRDGHEPQPAAHDTATVGDRGGLLGTGTAGGAMPDAAASVTNSSSRPAPLTSARSTGGQVPPSAWTSSQGGPAVKPQLFPAPLPSGPVQFPHAYFARACPLTTEPRSYRYNLIGKYPPTTSGSD
eukprot:jgi/Mesvir1/1724/Mv21178-RA.1